MRPVLCAALVACSAPTSQPTHEGVPFVVAPNDAGPLSFGATPVRSPRPERPLWNSRHSLVIESIATDGVAVVSLDVGRHARLWPSLDGRRQPWVLPLAQPAQVAVESTGAGFAVAALDITGALEVLAIRDDGVLTAHVHVDSELGFSSLIAIDDGFLAVRVDHVIEWFDRAGVRRASLAAKSGDFITRVLHAGSRTLVLVTTRSGMLGRWLEVGDTLTWGGETAMPALDSRTAYLSPDALHLIAMPIRDVNKEVRPPVLVDLQRGRVSELTDRLSGNPPWGHPIGFASSRLVVFVDNENPDNAEDPDNAYAWWDLAGRRIATLGDGTYPLVGVVVDGAAIAGDRVVAFGDADLAIATPAAVTWLGYRSNRPPRQDAIAVAGDLELARFAGADPDYLEAAREVGLTIAPGEVPRIALVDRKRKRELQTWPFAERIRYEPATRILAIDRGTRLDIAQFDPVGGRFGPVKKTKTPPINALELLDPALAGGNIAVTIHGHQARTWRDLQAMPPAVEIAGVVEEIDRTGRIYTRDSFPHDPRMHIRPSPDGHRVAAFGRGVIVMLDARGNELWTVPLSGVTDVSWSADELIVRAQDLSRLSVVDGSLITAQCGWSFGLHAKAAEERPDSAPICDR